MKDELLLSNEFLLDCEAMAVSAFIEDCEAQQVEMASVFLYEALFTTTSQFVSDAYAMSKDDVKRITRRYTWPERRKQYEHRARELEIRIQKVRDFDIWKHGFIFKDKWTRYHDIKRLYRKRDKLLFILTKMYHLYAVDWNDLDINPDKFTYARLGRMYEKIWKGFYTRREHEQTEKDKALANLKRNADKLQRQSRKAAQDALRDMSVTQLTVRKIKADAEDF